MVLLFSNGIEPVHPATLRRRVQDMKGIGVTEAQQWCANQLHVSTRTFQRWETKERYMNPTFNRALQVLIVKESRQPTPPPQS